MPKAKKTIEEDLQIDIADNEGLAPEAVEEVEKPAPAAKVITLSDKLKAFLIAQGAVVTQSPEFKNVFCIKYKGQNFDMNVLNDLENIRTILASRGFDEDAVAVF